MKGLIAIRAYLQSSGRASNEDMFLLSRLENKFLKDKLAVKDTPLKQKTISNFFKEIMKSFTLVQFLKNHLLANIVTRHSLMYLQTVKGKCTTY